MDSAPIRHCPLFKNAADDDIAALLRVAEQKTLLSGEELYLSGSDADAMYFIEMGTVEIVMRGKDLPVATVGSPQFFGDIPFFLEEKRAATARARETTHITQIAYDKLAELLDQRPALATLFYRNAAVHYGRLVGRLSAELQRPYF